MGDEEPANRDVIVTRSIMQWSPLTGKKITTVKSKRSKAHVAAGVVQEAVRHVNGGRVCNQVIAHEYDVAFTRRIENVALPYDARCSGNLQKRKR